MKVAHLTVLTPGRCGLYETTRELVVGLRAIGIDSRMVDPAPSKNPLLPKTSSDRGAVFGELEWAREADVLVSHSGLGDKFSDTTQPTILVCHGRPRHSFLTEQRGSTPVLSHHYRENRNSRLKAVVTFWRQHVPYHTALFPDKKVVSVTAPVDLERFIPGASGHRFKRNGGVNVLCTDAWRDDVDPFYALMAFANWSRGRNARLHLIAVPKDLRGFAPIIRQLQDQGNMGDMLKWVKGVEFLYRKVDVTLTGHHIDTRTVRESMACGCPVVRVNPENPRIEEKMEIALNTNASSVRAEAETRFNPRRSAAQFAALLGDV